MCWGGPMFFFRNIARCLVLFFLTSWTVGCAPPQSLCKGGYGQGTLNPNGNSCREKCECNNQQFTGLCVEGTCVSVSREPCNVPGQDEDCAVPKELRGKCRDGVRKCEPVGLKESGNWGDCIGITPIPVEEGPERCGNDKDDDCDGKIDYGDDSCVCKPGATAQCYSGKPETKNKGNCKVGIKTCTKEGKWGACEKQILPQEERCNLQDDDCDGKVDEDIPGCKEKEVCKKGDFKPCYKPAKGCLLQKNGTYQCKGNCRAGTQTCTNTLVYPEACSGEVIPEPERCNGADDDCDGQTDEDFKQLGQPCSAGSGACKKSGRFVCKKDGSRTECDVSRENGTAERCDGIDNNCNGIIDENLKRPCYTKLGGCKKVNDSYACHGECQAGTQTCDTGKWRPCYGEKTPSLEICDGKDNDCNGNIDDGITQECFGANAGCLRKGGVYQCTSPCKVGQKICISGKWGSCQGSVVPSAEICDGKDNNCNGKVDETFKTLGNKCVVGKGECQKSGTIVCKKSGFGSQCSVAPGNPVPEVCDGKDNDCDGVIDNAFRACYTGGTGCVRQSNGSYQCTSPCQSGTQSCKGNQWTVCKGEQVSAKEICNNKDDDCNGKIDDNSTDTPTLCSNQKGVCKGAKPQNPQCKNGKWSLCAEADFKAHSIFYKAIESCDVKDNNCNGKIDEGVINCVTTLAGSGQQGFQNGPATSARFVGPGSLVLDPQGNVYVADNSRIRKIDTSGNVTTFAGSGKSGYLDGPAKKARFGNLSGVAIDLLGSLYVADSTNRRVRKIDTQGNVTTVAGTGQNGYQDGPGTSAMFGYLVGIAVDRSGTIYVVDGGNQRIRKIDVGGYVTTLAGTGRRGLQDGPGSTASFDLPTGIAMDGKGNLYIGDSYNHRIRKIDRAGNVTTLAGSGPSGDSRGGFQDGLATTARFNKPSGVAVDQAGNLYVADRENFRIRKISPQGRVSTVSGVGTSGFLDGTLTNARFDFLLDVAVDQLGNVYVADLWNYRIRKITLVDSTCTTQGAKRSCYTGPSSTQNKGPCKGGTQTCNNRIWSVCTGEVVPTGETCNNKDDDCDGISDNNLLQGALCAKQKGVCVGSVRRSCVAGIWQACTAADYKKHSAAFRTTDTCDGKDNDCDGSIDEGQAKCVSTIAGSGLTESTLPNASPGGGYLDGPAASALFRLPIGIAMDVKGNLYIAESRNRRIRKISPQGVVSTLAGDGKQGYQDGPGKTARFVEPTDVAVDGAGNVYVTDTGASRIRKIDISGYVTTFAGSSVRGFKDGPAKTAQFFLPRGLAFDSLGNLYVADSFNRRIRKIDKAGHVSTFAGSGVRGRKNGPALTAQFNHPTGIVVDRAGSVFVSDTWQVRKIDKTGNVTTLAGIAQGGYKDGPPSTAMFASPIGIAVDAIGNVYVADSTNHRIRKIDKAGNVSTLAGSGRLDIAEPGGYQDGASLTSRFNYPTGVVVDAKGNVYVADSYNHRIRRITP